MEAEIRQCRIGDQGEARSALAPSGVVEIHGVEFSARAAANAIDVGTTVVVVDGDIGGLVVRPTAGVATAELPNFGKDVFGSFGDRAKANAAREAQERQAQLEAWRRKARRRQLQMGTGFGLLTVWLLWPLLSETNLVARIPYGFSLFACGFAWAVAVFRAVNGAILKFDEEFVRLSSASTILALGGSAFGLWSISSLGTVFGLALTLAGAVAGAILLPIIASLFLINS